MKRTGADGAREPCPTYACQPEMRATFCNLRAAFDIGCQSTAHDCLKQKDASMSVAALLDLGTVAMKFTKNAALFSKLNPVGMFKREIEAPERCSVLSSSQTF